MWPVAGCDADDAALEATGLVAMFDEVQILSAIQEHHANEVFLVPS